MSGCEREAVQRIGRRQQAAVTCIHRNGLNHGLFTILWRQVPEVRTRNAQLNIMRMIARAHNEQDVVLPRDPVQQSCPGTHPTVERPRTVTYRQVDDANARSRGRFNAFIFVQPPHCSMHKVYWQDSLGYRLEGLPSEAATGLHKRPDIHRPSRRLAAFVQVAVTDERSHGRSMNALPRLIVTFESIRIVNDKSPVE